MPRPLQSSSPLLVALLLAAACGKFEVRSQRAPGVPPALLGRWEGAWTSSGTLGGGVVELRVQEFRGEPVVRIALDNPCLVSQSYELAFVGGGITLSAGGETVLRAVFHPDRTLTGDYSCPGDSGTFAAEWHSELPVLLDLSGRWRGTAQGVGVGPTPMVLDLVQDVVGGSMRLVGTVAFPDLMPAALPVSGTARFREDAFDVSLDTTAGVLPALQLAGVGSPETVTVQQGLMLVSGGGLLPPTGVWHATRTPE